LHAFHPDHQKFNSHFSINLVVFVGGPESGVDLFFLWSDSNIDQKGKKWEDSARMQRKIWFQLEA
jgi:hypothetical protein